MLTKFWLLTLTSLVSMETVYAQASDHGVKPLQIATEADYPPFNWFDESEADPQSRFKGADIDMVKAACVLLERECEFVRTPFGKLLDGLIARQYDVVVHMLINKKREATADFVGPVYSNAQYFVGREGQKLKNLPGDLVGRRISAQKNTAQAEYLQALKQQDSRINFTLMESGSAVEEALVKGATDLIINDQTTLNVWSTRPDRKQFVILSADVTKGRLGESYFGEGGGWAIRKKNSELKDALNRALHKINADGTMAKIKAKYFK